MRIALTLSLLLLLPSLALAKPLPPETPQAKACPGTPAVGAIAYPGRGKIPTTNNLVTPTGKPDPAQGQVVYLMGKLVDQDCKPLPDVLVELWHPDPFSKFIIPTESDRANPIPMFGGAGQAYTGADGTFAFTTLFPGTLWICLARNQRGKCIRSLERAPFFNIRIAGRSLRQPFMAGLFFENDRRNPTDPVYKKLSLEGKKRLTMKVLPDAQGAYGSGMRTYIDLVVQTKPHWNGY